MVASSAQQSAPVIVIKPATAHANSNQPGAPINRADSADTMKMPEPIIDPITIMVASTGPRARTKPVPAFVGEAVGFPGTTPSPPTEADRFSILSFIWKTSALELSRLLSQAANAMSARIPPLPVCRHARKLFLPVLRHLLRRPIALSLRATFAERAPLLLPDRAARRPAEFLERVSHRLGNCGLRRLRKPRAISPPGLPLRARCYPAQTKSAMNQLQALRGQSALQFS